MSGFIVWDCRNGRVIPAIGAGDNPEDRVYSEEAANNLVQQLNRYLLHNNSPVLARLTKEHGVKIQGPFYVRPAYLRAKLEGQCIGANPEHGMKQKVSRNGVVRYKGLNRGMRQ